MGNVFSIFGSGDSIPDIPLDFDCKYINNYKIIMMNDNSITVIY